MQLADPSSPRRPTALLAALLLCDIAALPAQATCVDRLLVANKAAASVSLFDPATGEELAAVPTGEGPHEIAISPDGRTAVVTNYGARQPGRTLLVIDIRAATVRKTIELQHTVTPDGGEPEQRPLLRPHGCLFVTPRQVLLT
ncbi:MAG: hypothetical protein KDC98_17730, partial [Planctomycetes bacterium]|nr:hypothetical protein [Planctomycetota bacterium]